MDLINRDGYDDTITTNNNNNNNVNDKNNNIINIDNNSSYYINSSNDFFSNNIIIKESSHNTDKKNNIIQSNNKYEIIYKNESVLISPHSQEKNNISHSPTKNPPHQHTQEKTNINYFNKNDNINYFNNENKIDSKNKSTNDIEKNNNIDNNNNFKKNNNSNLNLNLNNKKFENNISNKNCNNNICNNNNNSNKKSIIIGSSYNLKINNIANNNNNSSNSNSNSSNSSDNNSDNYLSYNNSDSNSCNSDSDSDSDNNSDNLENIKINNKIINSNRNTLIFNKNNQIKKKQENNKEEMMNDIQELNIESLNNYFVNYFQDSIDIELVKIHLNSGYFIAGSNCSGSLEIILNNDIKTAGINLKWKVFEHVVVSQSNQKSSNNLSKDSSFEIIDASSMLSAYSLKEGNAGSPQNQSPNLKSSNSSILSSKSSTPKKNSKVFNSLKSSVNTLKNSSSINSFLKISSSSSSFNLQNHYGIQNEKCQQKRTIYKSVENIFTTDDSDGIMSAGTHIIPFSFPIPSHLPSSFCDYSFDKETGEKIISAILYRLSVSFVESVQQFKLKKSFSVCEPSIVSASVNEIPLKCEKKKSFIGSSGFLHLKVLLKRNVFFPGEKIPIQLKIENSTSKSIEYIQISIKKIQTLLLNKQDFLKSAALNNSGSFDKNDILSIEDSGDDDNESVIIDEAASSVGSDINCKPNKKKFKKSNNLIIVTDKDGNSKKICKKNSIKTLQKYNGVGAHSNYSETITFNTDEIKSCNQSTNGTLINCKYQLIVQCVIKRTLHSVRVKLPILFGNLPSNDAETSIFEDEYKLYLLNI